MKKITFLILLLIIFVMPCFAKQTANDDEMNKNTIIYLNLDWWENYKDEFLINHLKKLYEANYDLKNAQLRVKENEKLVKMQLAEELPSLSFDGFVSRDFRSSMQKFGDMAIPNYSQTNIQLPLTMSYEIDIWGKNRLKTKRNKEQLKISEQQQRAAYISVSSDFAAEYFNLIKTDKLISIQNQIISIQQDIISKVKEKNNAGLGNINEVLQEEKLLTVLEEERNQLEEQREILLNNLSALLSSPKEDIIRKSYDDIVVLYNLPSRINSEIINNRPDYIIREANIKQAGYDTKIAKKELLPSFVIFGQLGFNAYSAASMFNRNSQLANAGIMPSFDIFSGGRKIAFLQYKKYKYEEALNNYHKTVLDDIKEVNLGLFNLKTAEKNYQKSKERLVNQHKINSLIIDKNIIGTASNLDTLYSEEAELTVQKDEVTNKINYLISSISLYKAVGGKNLYKLNEDI